MNAGYVNNNHIGKFYGKTPKKYSYIINQEDLTSAWLQMHNDLGYPLMMDSKYHRAIVYNKEGLEKQIEKMLCESIYNNIETLADVFAQDTVDDIVDQLNNLVQSANGVISIGNSKPKNKSKSINKFSKLVAKELVNGITNIVKDITQGE